MTKSSSKIETREVIGETLKSVRFERIHFDTKFTDSTFESVAFDQCRLDRVLMARTKWSYSNFRGSTLVVEFTDAVFEDCSFHDVTFKGLQNEYGGIRARFVKCDFSRATFNQVCLRACRFVDCCFDGARLLKCDVRGTLHNGLQMANTG
jgi:uncharacterized protein YjbI with pentapeptide repeats